MLKGEVIFLGKMTGYFKFGVFLVYYQEMKQNIN